MLQMRVDWEKLVVVVVLLDGVEGMNSNRMGEDGDVMMMCFVVFCCWCFFDLVLIFLRQEKMLVVEPRLKIS